MVLKPGPNARPHFFLVGYRAPLAGTVPPAQRVGVLVARDAVRFDGSPGNAGAVLMADEPYAGAPAAGPFRYESELAPFKPWADVVVVDVLASVGLPFGTVEVKRGLSFGTAHPLRWGWRPRTDPARLALAGRRDPVGRSPSSLDGFDAAQFDLPDQFDNAFHNGGPLPGEPPFAAGTQLRFRDLATAQTTLTVPAAPTLAVTQDGQPLSPPPPLQPRVDTVVMDRGTGQFVLVWRAVFPWQARYETATLEVD